MGSFNSSCAISQLPVKVGDEVKLFLLVNHYPSDRNTLYPNHHYDIVGLPMDATYDDYGRYKLIDSERNNQIWAVHKRWLAENLIQVPKGDGWREEEVNPETIDMTQLQEAIWNCRAKIRHQRFDDMPEESLSLAVFPVHKALFENLSVSFEKWNGIFSTEEVVNNIQQDPMYKYLVDAKNFMETFVDDEEDESEEAEAKRDAHASIRMYERIKDLRPEPNIFHHNDVHLDHDNVVKSIPMELHEYMDFVPELVSTYTFKANLNRLNIIILPSLNSGQTYFYQIHKEFHESIVRLVDEKKSQCEDWER